MLKKHAVTMPSKASISGKNHLWHFQITKVLLCPERKKWVNISPSNALILLKNDIIDLPMLL